MGNGAKGYADKSMVLTLTLMRMWNRDEEDEAEIRKFALRSPIRQIIAGRTDIRFFIVK